MGSLIQMLIDKPVVLKNLPCNTFVERRVLNALMTQLPSQSDKISWAVLTLDDDCFYHIENKIIFGYIVKSFNAKQDFSLATMLQIENNSLHIHILSICMDVLCHGRIMDEEVETLIKYKKLRRQMLSLVSIANDALAELHIDQSLEMISQGIAKFGSNELVNLKKPGQSLTERYDQYMTDKQSKSLELILPVHRFPPLKNNSLITICGRSGVGKTNFGLYLMYKILDCCPEKQAVYFNLEMSPIDLLEREICVQGIPRTKDGDFIDDNIHHLLNRNVEMVSQPVMRIEDIEYISRFYSTQKPIGVIVVDYISLIRSKSKSERNDLEQADIAKRLAGLSIELNCVVIALSQVNREYKNRPVGDRVPYSTDAAESMGTVNSSYWWIGIDRPEIDDPQNREFKGLFQIACRKNRGTGGYFKSDFHFENGVFSPWSLPYAVRDRDNSFKEFVI